MYNLDGLKNIDLKIMKPVLLVKLWFLLLNLSLVSMREIDQPGCSRTTILELLPSVDFRFWNENDFIPKYLLLFWDLIILE